MFVLLTLAPLLPDDSRALLRAAQAQDRRLTGAAGAIWYPSITKAPAVTITLFDGDFTTSIDPGSASFSVNLLALGLCGVDMTTCRWPGAEVKIYAVPSTDEVFVTSGGERVIDEFGNFVIDDLAVDQVFTGRVDSFTIDGQTLSITAKVDDAPFSKNVLTLTYAGTGDAEGDPDLKDKLKPWVFGRAMNVEPVLINTVDNVFQFSAYGPIEAVNAMYERGSSFGASLGDHADYAALVAATIPEGRWATCLAHGLVRLGAPPYGVITGDVDGDSPAGGDWIRLTGAILRRVALNAGVDAALLAVSLEALDIAVPYPVNLVLTDQETVLALARRMVPPCNAQAGISWLGQLFATRVEIGDPLMTLDAQGRQLPVVLKSTESDVSPPYKRIQMGAARCWRVHTLDEIASRVPLIEKGDWDAGITYREGNLVRLPDGSEWEYVNPTASAGHDPREVGSVYWTSLAGRVDGPRMSYIEPIIIQASYAGVVQDGQLPALRAPRRFFGNEDVTADTSWSVAASDGLTVSINNTPADDERGTVSLTALTAAAGSITITSSLDGIDIAQTFSVTRQNAAAPVTTGGTGGGGGGGEPGTPATDTTFVTIDTNTTHQAISDVLSVIVGTSGEVDCAASLAFSVGNQGTFDSGDLPDGALMALKWAYSADGSTGWTDLGTETTGSQAFNYFYVEVPKGRKNFPGSTDCNQNKTGLMPGDTAWFRLMGRNYDGSVAITGETGSATVRPV